MEVCVRISKYYYLPVAFILLILILGISPAAAQLKIGYINSNQILQTYQEAIDASKKLQDIDAQWKKEARDMETELQEKQEQLEAQSLLLSEERKQEKAQEIQTLYLRYQQYIQEKWNPQNGEAVKTDVEFMEPVHKTITATIKKIGEEEGYHYIFDTVASNIVYASDNQPNLTDKLLEELNKGLQATTATEKE